MALHNQQARELSKAGPKARFTSNACIHNPFFGSSSKFRAALQALEQRQQQTTTKPCVGVIFSSASPRVGTRKPSRWSSTTGKFLRSRPCVRNFPFFPLPPLSMNAPGLGGKHHFRILIGRKVLHTPQKGKVSGKLPGKYSTNFSGVSPSILARKKELLTLLRARLHGQKFGGGNWKVPDGSTNVSVVELHAELSHPRGSANDSPPVNRDRTGVESSTAPNDFPVFQSKFLTIHHSLFSAGDGESNPLSSPVCIANQ